VTDDGQARPDELETLDVDLTEDQAASQPEAEPVGAQQRPPILVVERPEGDVAKLR
jgi:hypothetical protein